jgi:hypothetical protein
VGAAWTGAHKAPLLNGTSSLGPQWATALGLNIPVKHLQTRAHAYMCRPCAYHEVAHHIAAALLRMAHMALQLPPGRWLPIRAAPDAPAHIRAALARCRLLDLAAYLLYNLGFYYCGAALTTWVL